MRIARCHFVVYVLGAAILLYFPLVCYECATLGTRHGDIRRVHLHQPDDALGVQSSARCEGKLLAGFHESLFDSLI